MFDEDHLVRFHDGEQSLSVHRWQAQSRTSRSRDTRPQETRGEEVRLAYVALTRAQSQVVAWWAPSRDEHNGGLSRLLRGRGPGEPTIRNRCEPKIVTDEEALPLLRRWEDLGALTSRSR